MKEITNKVRKKVINELRKEIRIWRDLKKYVNKHLKGKTLTRGLDKEIDYMLKERNTYLKNILK